MALNPTFLTQFSQFAKQNNITPDAAGLAKAATQVTGLSNQHFNLVLQKMLPLLKDVNENIPGGAQAEITKKLADLEARQGTLEEQKKWFNSVLLNKAIQDCLVAQLQAHQQKSGLSDEDMRAMDKPKKQSFIQEALEGFSKQFSEAVISNGARQAYDPIGLFFNFLFDGLGMVVDNMMGWGKNKNKDENRSDDHPKGRVLPPAFDPKNPHCLPQFRS
jgi:hypothetical protein